MMFKNIMFWVLPFFLTITVSAQNTSIYCIAFYNLDNLFDTSKDNLVDDLEYTPDGQKRWNKDKFESKLKNISCVINQINPDILGIAEIENKKVIEALINQPLFKNRYRYVHEDSADPRGIDVALLYQPTKFKVLSKKVYPFRIPGKNTIRSRDILVVSGILDHQIIHILVNHWPSRRGVNSTALRERSAGICKQICDSIFEKDINANIVILGDFNDNPSDKSLSVILNAKKNPNEVTSKGLYNTMWSLYEQRYGTIKFANKWNLFDQIIVSQNLIRNNSNKLKFLKADIYNRPFLLQNVGKEKGYPLRTYSENKFLNGYSDHLPSMIYLSKNK